VVALSLDSTVTHVIVHSELQHNGVRCDSNPSRMKSVILLVIITIAYHLI